MALYIYREVNGLNCCIFEVLPIQEGTPWTLEFSQNLYDSEEAHEYTFDLCIDHGNGELRMDAGLQDQPGLSEAQRLHGLRRATAAIMTQLNTNRYVSFDELIQIFLHKRGDE